MIPNATILDGLQMEAYIFPASFAQQRLWFFDQLVPEDALYNVPAAVRLTGLLNVLALEQALNEIVRRHETLRSAFRVIEGQLVQAITPNLRVPLPLTDLRSLPLEERQAQQQQFMLAASQQPFNLAQAPLFRVKLLQLDTAEYMLLVTLHHIVADGWSIGVLMRELSTLYSAFARGNPSPLPELPIQYSDFAQWQRQWLQGEVLQTQLEYWRQQLAGLSVLDLPIDRSRPASQRYRGAMRHLELPLSLSQALENFSRQAGVTLFITLLAAFQTLLYRYTGQTDIAIGSPIANRNRSEIEGLIGFFVNTLVLRADLSGNPTFRSLLERVRAITLAAYSHQDLPFERLVEDLQPTRSLSHTPLVQVMFALQSTPTPPLDLIGLRSDFLELESHVAKFDLTLSFENTAQGLKGSLEYSTDLFDVATIDRLLQHFQILLEGIVAEPDQSLAELPLLTAAERKQLLTDWNNTTTDYPQNRCFAQLFEAQVEQTPDAVALSFSSQQLTYRELNQRANQLAHYLQQLGVKSEVLVGLCCDRSPELVIGMLAILKAGGAYVPLDPHAPPERLQRMAAPISVLLTQQHLAELGQDSGHSIVCLDRDWQAIAQHSSENLISNVHLDHLAYVIFTSGSTGQPKGVQIEQRGLLNLVFWHQQAFQISPGDRATQIAAPAFDACGWEVLPYLAAGASIHFPDQAIRISPENLRDWLVAEQITVSFLPTPLAEQMLSLDWSGTALRLLLVGGDRLHCPPPASLPFQVINNYGPTENTVVTTSGLVSPVDTIPAIGRPIANTQVYVLDANLQPVPIGANGELYISGAGLARGYLNAPEQTAASFIPLPFQPGARFYKTGDRVRYRSDGQLLFLDRLDQQVKIRGFRVELGEVEAAIAQHPQVQAAVVLVKDCAPVDRLVAYVVADGTPALDQFLKAKLPEYMIPTAFVKLDALPLTANGKVDRQALSALDISDYHATLAVVAPRNAIETTLAQLWTELLGLKQVSIYDNFFALGGHSLLATQLTSRIRDILQIDVPLQIIFESPSIAAIAEYIETVRWAVVGLKAPELVQSSAPAASDSREEVEF
jgi:amino acid adenylation domain-containing protein